jgi:hypothetical protein
MVLGMLVPMILGGRAADQAAEGQLLGSSPDGRAQLRRLQAGSGEHGEARKDLRITTPSGDTLYQWTSPLGTTAALWSPDSRYLAVNDGPGDQGDQLRVFRLDLAAPPGERVLPVREPDGGKLHAGMEERHGHFLCGMERVTLRALEWREGRLWCSVSGRYSFRRDPSLHVPFHYLWVMSFPQGAQPVLEEEWVRTDPKERAVRDR